MNERGKHSCSHAGIKPGVQTIWESVINLNWKGTRHIYTMHVIRQINISHIVNHI